MTHRLAVLLLALSAALPAACWAALTPTGCTGDPIVPTQVIEGEFGTALQGSYVMVPFDVPAGTTAVRVKYCWDDPEGPTTAGAKHTVDLGLWDARPADATWGPAQFRGWGGSSHPDVTVSPQGFSTEAEYGADPKGDVPGRTTRGFLPGPIPPGTWAAELGVGGVVSQADGDADGIVRWRVEIQLSTDPEFAAEPYSPAPYDATPARTRKSWYAGDLHVHAEHSSLGDATMTEVFDYAFRSLADGGAGLDFITLTDYVTPSAWGEIGRYQGQHPGKLVLRSSEVITYRGHTNNQASLTYVDHRTGPVYERAPDGSLTLLRAARPASAILADVRAHGGFTQINHPTIFPSSNPIFRLLCRGCPWDYSSAETDLSLVDVIEIQTGPGAFGDAPNPFTLTAIAFWEAALAAGHHIAAVGVSDSHHAGETQNATQSPIGQATTVVYATSLSEAGIRDGIKAGHTYVKLLGNAGPDLRLQAKQRGVRRRAIVGDVIVGGTARFRARVLNADGGPYDLIVLRDGVAVQTAPVAGRRLNLPFDATVPGRYRLQLQRGAVVVALTSPIYLEP